MTLDNEGLDALSGYLAEYKPRLVIIDPLVGYLGGKVDMHKGNEVRQVTAGLADLAEKFHCSILGIRHLTKGGRDKAIYRGIGSIDFTAAARSVLLAGTNSEGQKAIIHIKSNIAAQGEPIGFSIEEGQFSWMGGVDVTADDVLASDERRSALEDAKYFLREILADGPVLKTDIEKEWNGSDATLRRAKRVLKVNSNRQGFKGPWAWSLTPGNFPEVTPIDAQTKKSGNLPELASKGGTKADIEHLCKRESPKYSNNNNLLIDAHPIKVMNTYGEMNTYEASIDAHLEPLREDEHLCDEKPEDFDL